MTRRSQSSAARHRAIRAELSWRRQNDEFSSAVLQGAVALEDDDTLGLSFLDVLCCGLGAAIALFLIFSVLEHSGVVGAMNVSQTVLGEDQVLATIGEVYPDLEERVANSVFQCVIRFEVNEGTPQPIPRHALSLRRPVRGMDEVFSSASDNKFFEYRAIKRDGVSPSVPLVFELRGPLELNGYSCRVIVGIGNSEFAQHATIGLPERVLASDSHVLFRIDLLNRESWIQTENEE